MKVIVIALILSLQAFSIFSQRINLDSLVRKHAYTIRQDNNQLSGDGFDFIVKAAHASQFVAVGESHGVFEIPPFTQALFAYLQKTENYQHFATEQDPVMMKYFSSLRKTNSLTEIVKRYPWSFTFNTDQELTMLDGISKGLPTGSSIWGCEQAYGAAFILHKLAESAPPPMKSQLLRIGDSIRVMERRGDSTYHYMYKADKQVLLKKLSSMFRKPTGQTAFLLSALKMSDSIYRHYRDGEAGNRAGYYYNSLVREEYMKDRFLEEYKAAAVKETIPKTVLKFGQWHLFTGLTPSGCSSFGSFVNDLARSNGKGYFNIYAIQNFAAGTGRAFSENKNNEHLALLAGFVDASTWNLIDLKSLRPYYRMLREKVPAERVADLRALVFGYDSILFFGNPHEGTLNMSEGH